jgi:TPR repeat protein
VAKDEKKAFEWYTKSAEQGDVLAKAVNNMVNAISHQSHPRSTP